MIEALDRIEVITLFAEDLAATRAFYARVFGREVVYEDDVSTVMTLGPLMINLLRADQAPPLVAPSPVAPPAAGARALLTIRVADADATVAAAHPPWRDAPQRPDRPPLGPPHRRLRRPRRQRLGDRRGARRRILTFSLRRLRPKLASKARQGRRTPCWTRTCTSPRARPSPTR